MSRKKHAVDPVTAAYMWAHSVQRMAALCEYVPTAHSMQTSWPVSAWRHPYVHSWHRDRSSSAINERVPALQWMRSTMASSEVYVPLWQGKQTSWPMVCW